MSALSLRELEQKFTELWLNRDARERFLKSERSGELDSDIDTEGVKLYASLLQLGQQDVMNSIYPFCARLFNRTWDATVEDYFRRFPATHYHLNSAANRFSTYLSEHQSQFKHKHPYIVELADYEWIEVEVLEKNVLIQSRPALVPSEPEHFVRYRPVLNPALVLRQYEYNIIKIAARIDSGKSVGKFGKPERLRVAAFRNPTTNRCTFLELGEIAFEIVQALSDHAHSYADLIKLSIARQPGSEPQQCVEEFLTMNDTLQKLNFFQGSALLDEAT